jgi:hypothetical protein
MGLIMQISVELFGGHDERNPPNLIALTKAGIAAEIYPAGWTV